MRLSNEEKTKIVEAEKKAYLEEAVNKAKNRGGSAGKQHGEFWLIVWIKNLFDWD